MKIWNVLLVGMACISSLLWTEVDAVTQTHYAPSMKSDTVKIDTASGLIIDQHLEMVVAQCATVCHSSQLIRANRFTRDGWQQKIRWMQANHNLWELGEAEKIILDYLEKNYAPTKSVARRAPLRDIEWYELKQ